MKIPFRSKEKGFTLVELMVVIAIIAILTGIIITGLVSSKGKSRDAKRASDLSQIQLAIEQYFDRCDQYPASPLSTSASTGCPTNNNVQITLGSFISVIPTDPLGASSPLKSANYGYVTNTTNTDYVLYTMFESSNSVLAQSAPNPSWTPSFISGFSGCANTATTPAGTGLGYCVRPN